MAAREWVSVDENAKEMLRRVSVERPCLVAVPPLQRLPLRPGNVLEIAGPSPSAKSQILLQVAITCVLPKDSGGFYFGGMDRLVMYFDLDCSFDVQRFSKLLKQHIVEACGKGMGGLGVDKLGEKSNIIEELHSTCMKRLSYIRCYNSFQFLASLKALVPPISLTIRRRMQKESEAHGVGVLCLMIDRKSLSLQSVTETVVQELRKLLHVQPVIVLATKITMPRGNRNYFGSSFTPNDGVQASAFHHECMPSAWQSLVTQRILLQVTDDALGATRGSSPTFMAKWLLPSLNYLDRFVVRDEYDHKKGGTNHSSSMMGAKPSPPNGTASYTHVAYN